MNNYEGSFEPSDEWKLELRKRIEERYRDQIKRAKERRDGGHARVEDDYRQAIEDVKKLGLDQDDIELVRALNQRSQPFQMPTGESVMELSDGTQDGFVDPPSSPDEPTDAEDEFDESEGDSESVGGESEEGMDLDVLLDRNTYKAAGINGISRERLEEQEKDEERRMKEEAMKKKAEEVEKMANELKKKAEDAKNMELEMTKKAEEAKRREEDLKKREDDMKGKERKLKDDMEKLTKLKQETEKIAHEAQIKEDNARRLREEYRDEEQHVKDVQHPVPNSSVSRPPSILESNVKQPIPRPPGSRPTAMEGTTNFPSRQSPSLHSESDYRFSISSISSIASTIQLTEWERYLKDGDKNAIAVQTESIQRMGDARQQASERQRSISMGNMPAPGQFSGQQEDARSSSGGTSLAGLTRSGNNVNGSTYQQKPPITPIWIPPSAFSSLDTSQVSAAKSTRSTVHPRSTRK